MKPENPTPRAVPVQTNWKNLRLDPAEIELAVRALDSSDLFRCPPGELSFVFMGDDEIARLHERFFDDPEPTDVITFEGSPEMDFAGEVCVSVEHALQYARRHGIDFSRELTLYLVHGYLHLSGFDDNDPADRRKMRTAEKKALHVLETSHNMPVFRVEEQT